MNSLRRICLFVLSSVLVCVRRVAWSQPDEGDDGSFLGPRYVSVAAEGDVGGDIGTIAMYPWNAVTEIDDIIAHFCEREGIESFPVRSENANGTRFGGRCQALRLASYEKMRSWRNDARYKTFNDFYNEAVHYLHVGEFAKGLARWDDLLRVRRGVPFHEYRNDVTNRSTAFADYVREKNLLKESMSGVLKASWQDGTCTNLDQIPNKYLPTTYDVRAKGSRFVASKHKIRHDADQIELLVRRKRLPPEAMAISISFRKLLRSLFGVDGDDVAVPNMEYVVLTESGFDQIGHVYQGLLHHYVATPTPLPRRALLNADLDWNLVEESYFAHSESTFADNMLSPSVLSELRTFCEEATIFYDVKPGYLGAYMNEGFSHPLLLGIANELRRFMPRVIGPYPLTQMWAYKYDTNTSEGIKIHADPAKINLNVWITADEAHLSGPAGLVVYLKTPPAHWSPSEANDMSFESKMNDFVRNAEVRRFEYRANRFVMFNSKYFHKTDTFHFKDCYTCRRINLTFLFG